MQPYAGLRLRETMRLSQIRAGLWSAACLVALFAQTSFGGNAVAAVQGDASFQAKFGAGTVPGMNAVSRNGVGGSTGTHTP
jgi:hypothetical protein